jgi:hypothetical protein
LIVIVSIPLLGLGCSKNTDEADGGFFGDILGETFDSLESSRKKAGNFVGNAGSNFIHGLNDEKKIIVDNWLKLNLLNNFGDPIDTVYASGVPTFDEEEGEIQDRFEYLFEKFPQLKKIVLQKMEIEAKEILEEQK